MTTIWHARHVSSSPDNMVPGSALLVGLGVLAALGLLVRIAATGPAQEPAPVPPEASAAHAEPATSDPTKSEDEREREDEKRTRDHARVEENILAGLPRRDDPESASLCDEVLDRGIQSVAPDFARSVEISFDAAVGHIQEVCAVTPPEERSTGSPSRMPPRAPPTSPTAPPVLHAEVVVVAGESLDLTELQDYIALYHMTSWYPLITSLSADSSTVTITTSLDDSSVPEPARVICGVVSIFTLDGGEGWLPTTVISDDGATLARSTGSGPCALQ